MRILDASQVATVTAEHDPALLRERAGYAVAQFCSTQFKFRSVCVICGTGEIGAAGLIAAAILSGIAETVAVVVLARGAGELAPGLAEILPPAFQPIWIAEADDFVTAAAQAALRADLVVDAACGAGFRSPLDARAARAVAAINEASGSVVAVDVPSGSDPDSVTAIEASGGNMVFPHGIIALVAPRPAHVFADLTAGPLAISEIGTQPAFIADGDRLSVTTGRDVMLAFPDRPAAAVERDFGHVLVVGGERGHAGAAALAGLAALHAGAGRVTIACPQSAEPIIAGFGATLMTRALPETPAGTIAEMAPASLAALLAGKDVVILGPGMSSGNETAAFVRQFGAMCGAPLVLDAGAASACVATRCDFTFDDDAARYPVIVLEPLEAIRGPADRRVWACGLAEDCAACVVVTGAKSLIAGASGEVWVNLTGGPALVKAGSREILAGLIGAALARRPDAAADPRAEHRRFLQDLSVAAAVHLHGLAGDIARDALHEHAVLAQDLLEALPEAFRICDRQVEQGLFYLHR